MFDLSGDYIKKDSDLGNCDNCKNTIFGNRYNLEVKVGDEIIETKVNFCESCYYMIIKADR